MTKQAKVALVTGAARGIGKAVAQAIEIDTLGALNHRPGGTGWRSAVVVVERGAAM